MPSTSAYMVAAAAASAVLFFVLWWILQGEENPWVPAGLAASVVMLVAAAAREVVMRRALTRVLLEEESRSVRHDRMRSGEYRGRPAEPSQSEILRGLEKQSAEADSNNTRPDLHLRVFQMCGDFLQIAEKSLTSANISAERRLTVRARQDRVRVLQKHHMLAWARNSAQSLTQEAQQRARLHEKIEAANRALECIDTALANYPEEEDLQRSAAAVREFVTTSRVAHWVELAQRATFKGRYGRAIDCYRDALFYLTRAEGDNQLAAEQITREIELLRARRATHRVVETDTKKPRRVREN
jgi:tetratricopeptide (TPR) repeat protein